MWCIEVKEDDGSLFAIYGPFSSQGQAADWWDEQETKGLVMCVLTLFSPYVKIGVE